jgi:hypothetical protein
MKHAMNQEHRQLMIDAPLMSTSLANGLRQRNDDVSKKRRGRSRSFPHGKGQDIRRLVTLTKGPIQATHPMIAHDFEAEQRVGFAYRSEDPAGKRSQGTETQLSPRQPHADRYRH